MKLCAVMLRILSPALMMGVLRSIPRALRGGDEGDGVDFELGAEQQIGHPTVALAGQSAPKISLRTLA